MPAPPRPDFLLRAFVCPYCGVYSRMDWHMLHGQRFWHVDGVSHQVYLAFCDSCTNASVWVSTIIDGASGDIPGSGIMVHPSASIAPPHHPSMPTDIAALYDEARAVHPQSPRSAAAILRLAMERLIHKVTPETKDMRLTDAIEFLKDKQVITENIYGAATALRLVGNHSVHPGKLTDEDIAETSLGLFDLMNVITEKLIAEPERIEEIVRRVETKLPRPNRAQSDET